MQLTEPLHGPPLTGWALAIGLHLAFFVSVQVSASHSSPSEAVMQQARPTVMAVRSIDVPSRPSQPSASFAPTVTAVQGAGPNAAPSQPLTPPQPQPPAAAELASRSPSPKTATASAATTAATATTVPTPPAPSAALPGAAALAPGSSATAPGSAFPTTAVGPAGKTSQDLPLAPQYRAAGSLDPGPKPLSDIDPDYPTRAGQQQGIVVLRLLINEQGVVDNVAVVRAAPAGYFEESALEAFGKALFSPGKLLGVAVKSQITIEVEFIPINRGATVSGRTY